mmetsp:Transcript_103219/g.301048  ORF Transcript_103219/g.301048 Transcript_103219/m.301048 type:complete len:87 (-) Transcript_103219:1158-1418(-)
MKPGAGEEAGRAPRRQSCRSDQAGCSSQVLAHVWGSVTTQECIATASLSQPPWYEQQAASCTGRECEQLRQGRRSSQRFLKRKSRS